MKFLQKNVYLVASGILVLAFFAATAIAQNQQLQCQPGEFDAGGFCKTVPTGCPYGDSVPMEKCEPTTPEEKAAAETTTVTPTAAPKETSICQQ